MKKIFLSLILIGLFLPNLILAQEAKRVEVWFFYDKECDYCAQALSFVNGLPDKYPNLNLRRFEVTEDSSNSAIFSMLIENYGIEDSGVPTTFIGDAYVVGYNEAIGSAVEQTILNCSQLECPSPGTYLQNSVESKNIENTSSSKISWMWIVGFVFIIILLMAMFWPKKNKMLTDLD